MTRIIPLQNTDLVATIDDADYEAISAFSWCLMKTHTPGKYYACCSIKIEGKHTTVLMHRMLTQAPKGKTVDHEDNDGLNNTRANMRPATYSQNGANMSLPSNNTTGFKGVSKTPRGRYRAQIGHLNEIINLGAFEEAIDAATAYDIAALKLHGEFAKTNESMGLIPTFVDMTPADLAVIQSAATDPVSITVSVPSLVYIPQRTRSLRRPSKPTILGRVAGWFKKAA